MKKVFKVITIGDSSTSQAYTDVGKTSIVEAYINHRFLPIVQPTLGACFYKKEVTHHNQQYSLEVPSWRRQIWDTAGQQRYRSLLKLYYRNCDAVVMVFDVSNRRSFQRIRDWAAELQHNCVTMPTVVLVGNKSDLIDSEQVSYQQAKAMAHGNWGFVYCSAKDQKNIDTVFERLVQLTVLNDHHKQQQRSKKLEHELELKKQFTKPKRRCC